MSLPDKEVKGAELATKMQLKELKRGLIVEDGGVSNEEHLRLLEIALLSKEQMEKGGWGNSLPTIRSFQYFTRDAILSIFSFQQRQSSGEGT